MKIVLLPLSMLALVFGCVEFPENVIRCETASGCPAGWSCNEVGGDKRRCFRRPFEQEPDGLEKSDAASLADTAADIGHHDASSGDAGERLPSHDASSSSGDDGTPPSVVAFEVLDRDPVDKGTLEDRTGTLTVQFSADVASDSITRESFRVRAAGIAVAGDPLPDGTNRAIFRPTQPWTLSTTYEVELSDAIRDIDGRPLSAAPWTFTVRDGRWSPALEMPVVADTVPTEPNVAMSSQGKAALAWTIRDPSFHETNFVYRALSDGTWKQLQAAPGAVWNLAINNAAWIATSTDDQLMLYDDTDQLLTAPFTTYRERIFQLKLTDDSVLLALHANDEELWLQVGYEEPGGGPRYSYVSKAEARYGELAILGGNYVAAWLQLYGMVEDELSVRATRNPGCELKNVDCVQEVSTPGTRTLELALASDPPRHSSVVVWTESQQGDVWTRIRAKRQSSRGSWESTDDVQAFEGPVNLLRIGLDERGRALLVWMQNIGSVRHVYSSVYKPDTRTWDEPQNLSGDSAAVAQRISLAVAANGNALLLWAETGDRVRWARYSPDKGWMVDPLPLNSRHKDAGVSISAVGMADDGCAYASWVDDNRVWVARYE